MPLSIRNITFMSADPRRLAAFWAEVMGYSERRESGDEIVIAPAAWGFPRLTFQPDASAAVASARVHPDLTAPDLDAEVARLTALGAAVRWRVDADEPGGLTWVVLADPDGNLFCVVQQPPNG